jgi:hypothetical protein
MQLCAHNLMLKNKDMQQSQITKDKLATHSKKKLSIFQPIHIKKVKWN